MKINKQQLQDEQLNRLPTEDDHPFEIVSAEETPNSKSSDGVMTKLKLKVYSAGKKHVVKANLGQWRNGGAATIKSFYDCLAADENEELFSEDLIGKRGIVHIKHGEFNGRKKAEVAWWVPALPGQVIEFPADEPEADDEFNQTAPLRGSVLTDDDVPF